MNCMIGRLMSNYPPPEGGSHWPCIEQECGAWHARDQACSILLIADALTLMQADLNAIAQSMPQ